MFAKKHGAESAARSHKGLLVALIAAVVAVALSGVAVRTAWAEESTDATETVESTDAAEAQSTETEDQGDKNNVAALAVNNGISTTSVEYNGQTGNWVYLYVEVSGETEGLEGLKATTSGIR